MMRGSRTTRRPGRPPLDRPEDEKLPVRQFAYGVQHILSMFGGVIAVPLIVGGAAGLTARRDRACWSPPAVRQRSGHDPADARHRSFGAQLPMVQGISFASVSTMTTIASEDGLRPVFGAIIVAGLIGLVLIARSSPSS